MFIFFEYRAVCVLRLPLAPHPQTRYFYIIFKYLWQDYGDNEERPALPKEAEVEKTVSALSFNNPYLIYVKTENETAYDLEDGNFQSFRRTPTLY